MTTTLYASFADIHDAEKAIGALLDHGIRPEDISMLANESHSGRLATYSAGEKLNLKDLEVNAKSGITTTTRADAEQGAMSGVGVGLGVGIIAAIASVFLPGIGIVLGGGAMAIALAGLAGTAGAGAIAGGTLGFLKDQGVSEHHAHEYHGVIEGGGALLAVGPQGMVPRFELERILQKYNAENMGEYSPM